MFQRRSLRDPVDYLRRGKDRRKLTNYLRTGSFKRISGTYSVSSEIFNRRIGLFVLAAAVLAFGLFHALF